MRDWLWSLDHLDGRGWRRLRSELWFRKLDQLRLRLLLNALNLDELLLLLLSWRRLDDQRLLLDTLQLHELLLR